MGAQGARNKGRATRSLPLCRRNYPSDRVLRCSCETRGDRENSSSLRASASPALFQETTTSVRLDFTRGYRKFARARSPSAAITLPQEPVPDGERKPCIGTCHEVEERDTGSRTEVSDQRVSRNSCFYPHPIWVRRSTRSQNPESVATSASNLERRARGIASRLVIQDSSANCVPAIRVCGRARRHFRRRRWLHRLPTAAARRPHLPVAVRSCNAQVRYGFVSASVCVPSLLGDGGGDGWSGPKRSIDRSFVRFRPLARASINRVVLFPRRRGSLSRVPSPPSPHALPPFASRLLSSSRRQFLLRDALSKRESVVRPLARSPASETPGGKYRTRR